MLVDVTRSWTISPTVLPADLLTYANSTLRFRALTIDNNSNCSVSVWLDKPAYTSAAPDFVIPSYFYKTIPIVAKQIYVAVNALANPPTGQVYVHAINVTLTAAAGSLSSGTGTVAPAPSGVQQLIAGNNVTISPAGGTGIVTVNASGGGGSGFDPLAAILAIGPAYLWTMGDAPGSTAAAEHFGGPSLAVSGGVEFGCKSLAQDGNTCAKVGSTPSGPDGLIIPYNSLSPIIPTTGPFSIMILCKSPTGSNNGGATVCPFIFNSTSYLGLVIDNTLIHPIGMDGATNYTMYGAAAAGLLWMFTYVFDSSAGTMKLFYGATQLYTNAGSPTMPGGSRQIEQGFVGNLAANSSANFNGYVQYFSVFDSVLSPAQIESVYNQLPN